MHHAFDQGRARGAAEPEAHILRVEKGFLHPLWALVRGGRLMTGRSGGLGRVDENGVAIAACHSRCAIKDIINQRVA